MQSVPMGAQALLLRQDIGFFGAARMRDQLTHACRRPHRAPGAAQEAARAPSGVCVMKSCGMWRRRISDDGLSARKLHRYLVDRLEEIGVNLPKAGGRIRPWHSLKYRCLHLALGGRFGTGAGELRTALPPMAGIKPAVKEWFFSC